jgi:hypothetical protein
MKKGEIILIAVIILAIAALSFSISHWIKPAQKVETNTNLATTLTQNQTIQIIQPKVEQYCQGLLDNANESSCLICQGNYKTSQYTQVTNLSESERSKYAFTIEKNESAYTVEFKVPRIAGSNDRPASAEILKFKINEQGNITEYTEPSTHQCNY